MGREVARWVMRPPLPISLRPAWRWFNLITVGMLPPKLREEYGFRWSSARQTMFTSSRWTVRNFVLPAMPDRWRSIKVARDAEAAIRAGEPRAEISHMPEAVELNPAA